MELSVPFQLALITVMAFVCQWASWRIKLPAILPLLLSGLLLGSVAGLIQPKQLFGDLLLPGVSLAVSIILFEGALTLRFSAAAGHLGRADHLGRGDAVRLGPAGSPL